MLSREEQERLIGEQHEMYNWLCTASVNVGKRGKPELTTASLKRHEKTSRDRWEKFLNNDLKLQKATDQSEEYFERKIFLNAKSLYEMYKSAVEKAFANCDDAEASNASDKGRIVATPLVESSVEASLNQMMKMMQLLSRDVAELQKRNGKPVETEISLPVNTEVNFGLPVQSISEPVQRREQSSVRPDATAQHREQQQDYEWQQPCNPSTSANAGTMSQTDHLASKLVDVANAFSGISSIDERLTSMQKFDGTPRTFRSWRMLFAKRIDAKPISNALKLENLKALLIGEPFELLSFIDITDDNYQNALSLLDSRYYDPQLLMDNEVDDFLSLLDGNFGAGKAKSQKLRDTHDITQRVFGNLKNIVNEVRFPNVNDRKGEHHDAYVAQEMLDTIVTRVISSTFDFRTNEKLNQFRGAKNINKSCPMKLVAMEQEFRDSVIRRKPGFDNHAQSTNRSYNQLKPKPRQHYQANVSSTSKQCYACDMKGHCTLDCRHFLKLGIEQRRLMARQKRLCYTCVNFKSSECRDHTRENNVSHPMLRFPRENPETGKISTTVKQQKTFVGCTDSMEEKITLLATAICAVVDTNGNEVKLRALIDQGSTCSFITDQAARLLNLNRKATKIAVQGIGNSHLDAREEVALSIRPHFKSNFQLETTAVVLKKITGLVPQRTILVKRQQTWPQPLADPTFDQPGVIDLLLSAKDIPSLMRNNAIIMEEEPLIQETYLGYIISGPTNEWDGRKSKIVQTFVGTEPEIRISDMERFWEIDQVEQEDNDIVEAHYKKTTVRNPDGSYTVQLPFKDEFPDLGESYGRAMARYIGTEKKLMQNPERLEQYNSNLREYLKVGHMRLVKNNSKGLYYIPHQAVIKTDSLTTPLRVVFDASARTSNGKSLNEVQHIGPRLQQDLQIMLLKFRKEKIAVVADITKMYRQIRMAEEHIPYQRILWRDHGKGPIQEFELTTVTFGLAAAPYLAIRTLQQLAEYEKYKHPKGATLIKNNFYVDDLIASFCSVEETQQAIGSLNELTKSGQFQLRKWASNQPKSLKGIDHKDLLSSIEVALSHDSSDTIKALGVQWTPSTDQLHINVQEEINTKLTKRNVLSVAAKIFDPLGLLAPATVGLKIIIQDIWKTNLDWDDEIPTTLATQWLAAQQELHLLSEIRIPRWMQYNKDTTCTVIGFSDASEKAYGAVVYMKCGQHVNIVAAKTRVAPIKHPLTLPRLELMAAVLLAELLAKVMQALDLEIEETEVITFSDSQITLAWIQGDVNRWNKFISNRVTKIINLIPKKHWFYVDTKQNPADHASRGIAPSELKHTTLWWDGPPFLKEATSIVKNNYNTNLETKKLKELVHIVIKNNNDTIEEIISSTSSWSKMIRIVAWCKKVFTTSRSTSFLSSTELMSAELIIVKYVQQQEFINEIQFLKSKKPIIKGVLANFAVILDDNEIIRVGGRLHNAAISYSEKHPMILPKINSQTDLEKSVTAKLIEFAHKQTLHGGVTLTLAYLRQKYVIIGMRNSVKFCIQRCFVCKRFKTENLKQQMGTLPADRVNVSPPFFHSSVDYAGPFNVKSSSIRSAKIYKCYIAVFVCTSTKAYHLELVSALTAEAFIDAFKRFIGRRGLVQMIRSDNGGNFVKGNKILNTEMKLAIKEGQYIVQETFADKGLEWKFMPPMSPHFGGLHEAAVKSVKNHLKKTIGETSLSYEGFTTVLVQIEAQLNSRPLILNNNGTFVLTPAHFLVGRTLNTMPEPCILDINPTNRYKMQQQMIQRFWKTWHQEYLHQLQQRTKWSQPTKNIECNQIVLLKNELVPPTQWKLTKVIETHPGADGLVRVVTVEDPQKKIYKRAINKVVILPQDPFVEGGENPVVPDGYRMLPRRSARNMVDQKNSRFFYPDRNTKQTYLSKNLKMMENTTLSNAYTMV